MSSSEIKLDQLQSFFEITPEFLVVLTEDGRITAANPAWQKGLGYEPQALLGFPFIDLLHPEDLSQTQLLIQKAHEGIEGVVMENRCLSKTGEIRWVRWTCHYFESEKQFYLVGRDISDLKEAEKSIEESQSKFQRLSLSATEGIALHENAVILEANLALARMLGYDRAEDLIGKKALDFAAPEFRQLILNHIQTGNEEPYEAMGLRRDGSRFNVLISGQATTYQGRSIRVSTFLDITKIKKREQELFESQELFRKLTEASKDGIAVNEKGVILLANPAMGQMFGYEVPEMIGRNALEFTAPEFRETLLKKIAEKSEASYEIMGLRRDGSRFPLGINPRMTTFHGRRVRLAYFRDITQRKKIEEEVLRQKEFNQNLINSSIDGIVAFDRECRYTLWNPAMERLTGHSREEVLGQRAFDVFPFLKQTGQDLLFREVLEGKRIVSQDQPFRTPAGRQGFLSVSYSPLKNNQGDIIGGLGLFHETTERKRMEEALRESETNLRAVFHNTFQNIILMNREGRIKSFNPNAAAFARLESGKELEVGRPFTEYGHPENSDFIKKNIERVLTGEAVQFERTFPVEEGEHHWFEVSYNPVFGASGEIEGICLTSLDIDQRKRFQEALEKSEADLRAVFNGTSWGFILISRNGRIQEFNQLALEGFQRMRGLELQTGCPISDYVEPEYLEAFMQRFKKALKGEVQHLERTVKSPSGVEEWFEFNYYPVLDSHSKVMGICLAIDSIHERKKAAEALLESEQKFRRIFENAPLGMTLVGKDFRFLHVNRAFCEMLGYREEELAGKPYQDITHPEDLPRNIVLDEEVKKGKGFQMQKRYIHKDRHIVWVNLTVQTILDAQGNLLYSMGMAEDITERKKVEVTLRESEERYRRLVELSPEALLVHSEGKVLYMNPSGLKMLGTTLEEMEGNPTTELLHPDSRSKALERAHLILEKGQSTDWTEMKMTRRNGELFDAETKGAFLLYGGKPSVMTMIRDVTDRKKAEKTLRESEERYRKLVELSPEALVVHAEGKVLYVNSAGMKMFAASPGPVEGRPILEFMHPDTRQLGLDRAKGIMESGQPTDWIEQRFIRCNGEPFDAETKGTPFLYQGVPAVLTLIRDVTERKKTQQMLMRYERLAAVGKVTAAIAHEIRNPLGVMSGMSEILKAKLESRSEYSQELETILSQANRLKYFMNDILDYSRSLEIHKTEIKPRTLLEGSLVLAQAQVGAQHALANVEWGIDGALPEFPGDEERLGQVLVNLIVNAYQALGEKGKIKLSAKVRDGWMILEVEDNGRGIPEGDLPRIFEPFFTTKKGGSGLGLSISQKIIDAHGGRMEVLRLRPRGTLFSLWLPLQ